MSIPDTWRTRRSRRSWLSGWACRVHPRPGGFALTTRSFLLPCAAGAPLPSFELLPYMDSTAPAEFDLAWYQVCCSRVPNVISTLNEIHFVALHAAEEFQLGADLLFWYQFTQLLKGVIARDQYIPSFRYRSVAPATSRRGRGGDAFELYPAWELVSEAYEAAISRFAAAMPAVCAAGLAHAARDRALRPPGPPAPLRGVPPARHRDRNTVYGQVRPARSRAPCCTSASTRPTSRSPRGPRRSSCRWPSNGQSGGRSSPAPT